MGNNMCISLQFDVILFLSVLTSGNNNNNNNNNNRKSRTNRELEELSKGEIIVKWIKGQRVSRLGYLERMEEDRMP
jgi:hypothetical protein